MSDLKACRICLRTKCRMFRCDRFQLKSYYEDLTAYKVAARDGMPLYFCYQCATTLHNFHKFKNKCTTSYEIMKDLIQWKGGVTYEAIDHIQDTCPALKPVLEIMTQSKRVKTYIKHYDTKKKTAKKKVKKKENNYSCAVEIEVKHVSPFEDRYSESLTDDFLSPEPGDDPVDSKDDVIMKPDSDNHLASVGNEQAMEIEPYDGKAADFDTKLDTFLEPEAKQDEKRYSSDSSEDESIAAVASKKKLEAAAAPVSSDTTVTASPSTKKANPNSRPAFTKQRKRFLEPQHWKQYTLTPEEAKQQFYGKAFEDKYLQSPFKCTDCLKGFSKEDIWQRHRVLLHAESKGRHECHFCHLRFKIDSHLRRHLRLHYTRYQCLRCEMVFNNQEIALLHNDNHSGTKKFKCSVCEHEFKHQSTYYTHMRTVHRSEFVCTLCGAAFVSQLGLRKHTAIKHCLARDAPAAAGAEAGGAGGAGGADASATYCDLCSVTFETRQAYEFHKHNSALHGTDLKGSNGQRKREFKSRPGKKPTACAQCGAQFATQSACMRHHQRLHPGTPFDPQRHVCEVCGASLAPGSLAMHMNIHSRENLFPCETCGKTFYSKAGLQRHHVTHTGEKPFACSLCDKRFTQNDSMKLHYRTYHLKQPYPKRNRSKKQQDIPEALEMKLPADPVFYLK